MPIEIAHYTLELIEGAGQEHYRILRVIQPGEEDILFDPEEGVFAGRPKKVQ